ncbi:hypothetical protein BOTBODRAFT_36088 [Botryobasidium botryosum FD-172 SS1]|uniref:Methyltransferase domain-containing protein n=1 Tax=Botryobasidium botryosum (strain FD-172 SS1) TaxID=930990 RepID=A0A067M4S0_BOTB1|nr:hypothetical protein BOTBODRAFT_36088 [Botryobasidium botryosum FD-172 SS1]
MLALGRVHPRFAALVVGGVLVTLLFLSSQYSSSLSAYSIPRWGSGGGDSLASLRPSQRIALADALYKDTLARRVKLAHKFGPSVKDVQAFPDPKKDLLYTLWDFFIPAPTFCAHRIERVGTLSDGGKWVCGLEKIAKKDDCVVYSFGVNGESSFEAEILDRTNCNVYGYDFSVDKWGPEIENDPERASRAHFFSYGISGKDAHAPGDNPPMYTLSTLMKMNGHKFIDILKVDIEGSEFETLSRLIAEYQRLDEPLPFGQMQIEIHAWSHTFEEFQKWWALLEAVGLRPFWTEPNIVYVNLIRGAAPTLAEYSFINIRGNHDIISDSH